MAIITNHGIVFTEAESPAKCEDCGEMKELRPYGPGGSRVCFQCAMKDEEGLNRRIAALSGDKKN